MVRKQLPGWKASSMPEILCCPSAMHLWRHFTRYEIIVAFHLLKQLFYNDWNHTHFYLNLLIACKKEGELCAADRIGLLHCCKEGLICDVDPTGQGYCRIQGKLWIQDIASERRLNTLMLYVCCLSVTLEYKVIYHYLAPKCPGDLVYSNCHSACPLHCNEPEPEKCITVCVAGCDCPSGLYRDRDRCYKKDDCPPSPGTTSKTI